MTDYDKTVHTGLSDKPGTAADKPHSHHKEKEDHRFQKNDRYFTIMVYGLLFVFCAILIYNFCGHFSNTAAAISKFTRLISPFLYGALIAFILFPLVKFFYQKLFTGRLHMKSAKTARILSILLAYIIAIGVIVILLIFIVPQIYASIRDLTVKIPLWYQSFKEFTSSLQEAHPDWTFLDADNMNQSMGDLLPTITGYLTGVSTGLLPFLYTTSIAIAKWFVNVLIAIMASAYMISDHRNIFYQIKRLLYALLPARAADTARSVARESARIFIDFIIGKAIDSLIIGIICFITMSLLRLPYTTMISVIVGVTNMIPYFGPYIGGVIGCIIVVIVDPIQALIFAVLILIIQQFDGLYLGPKILGDKTGLSPLWVIVAITIGGSLFGVLGMFLGVPVFAVLAYILNLVIQHFLKKRRVEVEPYDSTDKM